jgi:hypothetical protein
VDWDEFTDVSESDGPDDGSSKDLRNVGKLIPVFTALQPTRQPNSSNTKTDIVETECGVVNWIQLALDRVIL